MATTLTNRQQEIYDYIVERIKEGVPPTFREIGEHFGIGSPNGVMAHLNVLEKKGRILRDPKISRGIYIADQCRGIPFFTQRTITKAYRDGFFGYCEKR